MKINNVFLTVILCFFSLSVWGQSDNLNVVRTHYPEIYNSIQDAARQQWDDAQVRQAVMEGQAKAFLALAESQDPMESGVLAEAILNNSLPNQKEYNTRILNDLSIENPFPLLRCDWFKVKAYYDRRVTSQYTAATRERQTPPSRTYVPPAAQRETVPAAPQREIAQTTPQREVYQAPERTQQTTPQRDVYQPQRSKVEEETPVIEDMTDEDWEKTYTYVPPTQTTREPVRDTSRDTYFDEYDDQGYQSYSRKRDGGSSPFHIGIRLGGGLSSMYNLGSYVDRPADEDISFPSNLQLKSKLGLSAEGGLAFMYKSGGFFAQNETGVQYSQAHYTAKIYNSEGGVSRESDIKNNYLYLNTAFHFGGYYELDKGVHLIAGVGPYVGFKLNANYEDSDNLFGNETEGEGENTKGASFYEKYMEKGEKNIMFGVSGVFGADINKFRIALYPSMGLTKVHDKEGHKPFGLTLGLTYWIF